MIGYIDWFRVSFFSYELVDDFDVIFVSGGLASGAGFVCSGQLCELAFSLGSSCQISGTLGFGQLAG